MKFKDLEMEMKQRNIINAEKRHWRIWFLLVFVTVLSVAVLITSQLLLYSGLITNNWPWQNTHLSLLAFLSLVIIGFISYLTVQEKKLLAMERQVRVIQWDNDKMMNRNAARFIAISNICRKMSNETDPERIFKYITETCLKLFHCDRASLMMLDDKADELVVRAISPIRENHFNGVRQKLGKGIAGRVAESRKALLLRRHMDCSEFSDFGKKIDKSISAMVVPIVLRDELVGIINVSAIDSDVDYEEDDMNALQIFADNAGAFIRHTEKAEWMRITIEKLGRTSSEADSKYGLTESVPPGK